MEVLKGFRSSSSKASNRKTEEADSDLQVQLDVFDEQRESDEAHVSKAPGCPRLYQARQEHTGCPIHGMSACIQIRIRTRSSFFFKVSSSLFLFLASK